MSIKRMPVPLCLALWLGTWSASAHTSEGLKLIAVLKSRDIPPYAMAVDGFKKALKDRNVRFQIVDYEPGAHKPDVVFALGSKATETALRAAKDVPVIFSMVMQPEKSGFGRPNVCGVSMDVSPQIQLEMLKRIVPGVKNVGVLYNPRENQHLTDEAAAAAGRLGLKLVTAGVHSVDEVYSAVRSLSSRIDALWMVPDATAYTPKSTEDVLFHTLREKIPVVGLSPPYVKAGALFAFSCDYEDLGKQAGEIAARALKGDAPDAAIVPPRKVLLSLNLVAAERIGVKIPEEVLQQAKDVYR